MNVEERGRGLIWGSTCSFRKCGNGEKLEIKCLRKDASYDYVSRMSKTHCLSCAKTRKWTDEFLSRKWLNVKEGWLPRKHYSLLTNIIYGYRKIGKLKSSGSKNEIVQYMKLMERELQS